MRILITNDDGIHSPGLDLLERIAQTLTDDVYVIAPEYDQSGVAHSLSLNDPLRLREVSPRHFAVKGTPTDCVIMGVRSVLADKAPDLVLSGVNRGQNVAEDVTYSGTIAGAMEGTILGVPSVALSQAYGAGQRPLQPALGLRRDACAAIVLKKLLDEGISAGHADQREFPDCPPDEVQGIAVTVQGKRDANLLKIDARHDGRGIPYYWIAFQRGAFTPGKGTDLEAIAAKKISLTPLRLDLTDEIRDVASTPRRSGCSEPSPRAAIESRRAALHELIGRAAHPRHPQHRRVARDRDDPARDVRAASLADLAPRDLPLPIACGQTMSEPSLVARMLEALDVGQGDRVLEVGTGSGYVTAILASLALHVVSIERFQTLAIAARTRVEHLGFGNVEIVYGDGLAAPVAGPFDRILVHLELGELPARLTEQLAAGGTLVCGRSLGQGAGTRLVRLVRNAHGDLEATDCGLCLLPKPIAGVAEAL